MRGIAAPWGMLLTVRAPSNHMFCKAMGGSSSKIWQNNLSLPLLTCGIRPDGQISAFLPRLSGPGFPRK